MLEFLDAIAAVAERVGKLDLQKLCIRRELPGKIFQDIILPPTLALALSLYFAQKANAANESVWSAYNFGVMFNVEDADRFRQLADEQTDDNKRAGLLLAARRLTRLPRPHDVYGILHLHDEIHGSARARDFAEDLANDTLNYRIETGDFENIESDGYCNGLASAGVLVPKPIMTTTNHRTIPVTYRLRAMLLAVNHMGDIQMMYGNNTTRRVYKEKVLTLSRDQGLKFAAEAPLGRRGFWARGIQKVSGNQVTGTEFDDYGKMVSFSTEMIESLWIPLHGDLPEGVLPEHVGTLGQVIAINRLIRNNELDSQIVPFLAYN